MLSGASTQTERITGLAGLVFLVLAIPAIVTEIRGPEPTTSVAEVATKFASARTDVLVSSVLLMGTATAFFVFIVGTAEISRRTAGDTLVVSLARSFGVVGIGVLVVYIAIFASLAAFVHQVTDKEIVYAIFRSAYAIDSSGDLFFGLFIATHASRSSRARSTRSDPCRSHRPTQVSSEPVRSSGQCCCSSGSQSRASGC
jgi:hypothetical protein